MEIQAVHELRQLLIDFRYYVDLNQFDIILIMLLTLLIFLDIDGLSRIVGNMCDSHMG